MLVWAIACAEGPLPDRLLVLDRQEDGVYELVARDRGGLDDPRRLVGELGSGCRGGHLDLGGFDEGSPLSIPYTVEDGVGVALDEQGLLMWSFWYQLADARDELVARGIDVEPIFPVFIAWSPQSVSDVAAVENAAYATGERAFLLFPDATAELPLTANAGVVRHEFGHAVFELLTSGGIGDPQWTSGTVEDILAASALNEGFADALAALLVDDPRFLDASVELPDRDLEGDWVATSDLYPSEGGGALYAAVYEKYALGSVFAAFVWDVRLAVGPDEALQFLTRALVDWAAIGAWGDVDGFVEAFVLASDGLAREAACASAAQRFPDVTTSCAP